MKVILENETEIAQGQLVISAGQSLQIGRQMTVGKDPSMSGLHFRIECKEHHCRIADMNSRNGTFVNGARIQEALLRDGDVITAGQTRFSVRIEEDAKDSPTTPVPQSTAIAEEQNLDLKDSPKDLRGVFSATPGENLYALLDAARDDRILELLREFKAHHQSLYAGQQAEDLANFAPYLVELPEDSPLLDALIKEGWGKSWGVYLTSSKSFDEVRKHFRHFVLVHTEDGQELYFRFYDPRVLRNFLPTCNEKETCEFFGPIKSFSLEDEVLTRLIRSFSHGSERMSLRCGATESR